MQHLKYQVSKEAIDHGRCACCKVASGVATDENSRSLDLSFCLGCMAASKDYAKCPCGAALPLLQRMSAAAHEMKFMCESCQKKQLKRNT